MIKILAVSGSPTVGSSTELLLEAMRDELFTIFGEADCDYHFVRLNELKFIPCQACGRAPTPAWCFYEDDLAPVYQRLAECDALLVGSPIYFDSVSAQLKAFIDRCNCFRPADFENVDPEHDFLKLIKRKRPGAMVLVGGKHAWFEGARRVIVGFFKWTEVVSQGMVTFSEEDFHRIGTVQDHPEFLQQARELGRKVAETIKEGLHAR